jgi:hypothetical protein
MVLFEMSRREVEYAATRGCNPAPGGRRGDLVVPNSALVELELSRVADGGAVRVGLVVAHDNLVQGKEGPFLDVDPPAKASGGRFSAVPDRQVVHVHDRPEARAVSADF